jgi:hypothetical protein
MLADGCESSVRARRPQNRDDIRETVDYIFEARMQSGQLDESGLTLNDVRLLRETFLTALQGVFHPRIAYPGAPGQGSETQPPGAVSPLPPGESVEPATVESGEKSPDKAADQDVLTTQDIPASARKRGGA